MAVLLVIALTIGGTLYFVRDGSRSDQIATNAPPSGINGVASANDTGAVSIITSEPTCTAWRTIQNALADAESNGWGQRDQSSESSSWTPQVRSEYEAVGNAMRSAADQAVALANQTPHRVMREMYQQFIAYGRAYAESLSSYQPKDDQLSLVNISLHNAIGGVCNAIDYGGAVIRNSPIATAQPPATPPAIDKMVRPNRFVSDPSSSCREWTRANTVFQVDLSDWASLDRSVPATA